MYYGQIIKENSESVVYRSIVSPFHEPVVPVVIQTFILKYGRLTSADPEPHIALRSTAVAGSGVELSSLYRSWSLSYSGALAWVWVNT